jgi:hypothetical protein
MGDGQGFDLTGKELHLAISEKTLKNGMKVNSGSLITGFFKIFIPEIFLMKKQTAAGSSFVN